MSTNALGAALGSEEPPLMFILSEHGVSTWQVMVANRFWTRLRGLMGKDALAAGDAMLLMRCAAVHTFFMRFAIDVLYLDARGEVLKCVERLKPWRFSACGVWRARHTLELPAGAIARGGIQPGDAVVQSSLHTPRPGRRAQPLPTMAGARVPERAETGPVSAGAATPRAQRGASLVEFGVVMPIISLMGMAVIQYGMLFNAKNLFNHAAFMAARAGSVQHADLGAALSAYTRALVPLYGGGKNATEIAASLVRAQADVARFTRVELVNPTREAFDAFNSPALQAKYKTGGKRVIPNEDLAAKPTSIDPHSGEDIQDANVLKLRFTQGYELKVPIVRSVYLTFLKWLDDEADPVKTAMLNQGRIPVDVYVTMRMQSDAIEPAGTTSSPGMGDGGKPVAAEPPPTPDPSTLPCDTASTCMSPTPSPGADGGSSSGAPGDGGGATSGGVCTGSGSAMTDSLGEAVLFDFDSYTLKPSASTQLDAWVDAIKTGGYTSVTINGYTDPLGSKSYNQTLSQKRADAVKDYLIGHGVDAGIVTAVGKGSTEKYATLGDCAAQPTLALEQSCLQPDRYVEMVAK